MGKKGDIALKVWEFFWFHGLIVGLIFILAPPLYDVFAFGFRNFFEWRIAHWGVLCQLIGAVFVASWYISKKI